MPHLRLLLAALALAVSLPALPAAAETIGVTAAVNPAAHGTPQGGAIRALTLGENVIRNERITTDAAGLVQVLFADGTTLTLGPRSDLVIDSFIYDPDKNTAELAATMSKGVLRFIGGLASKGDNPATITVPTGTIGIRGAITDVSLDTSSGNPAHIDMLFGQEVTLSVGADLLGRLYQGGYSLGLGAGGVTVVKTPPQWSSQIQAALTGPPGSNGGAAQQPTNQTVAQSSVPASNTQRPLSQNLPPQPMPRLDRPGPVEPPPVIDVTDHHGGAWAGGASAMFLVADSGTFGWTPAVSAIDQAGNLLPSSVTVDSSGHAVAADLYLQLPGCFQCLALLHQAGGTGTLTIYQGQGWQTNAAVVPVTTTFVASRDMTLPSGTHYCTCDFLDWGTWSLSGHYDDPTIGPVDLAVTNGTWFAGDFTTGSQLASLASTTATFSGHAIGSAVDYTSPGASHLATGDMTMQWSFGSGTGNMAISNFDGRNFQGNLTQWGSGFVGALTGPGSQSGGYAQGGFVNDGSVYAKGVAGNLWLIDQYWMATGIFVGQR